MSDPVVTLIVAMTPERVIGRDGDLPWHLPADLKHFKAVTMGKPIVMGRKTYESIGKPLPGRHNVVVTRNTQWRAEGVTAVTSVDAALAVCAGADEVMIVGGAQIYAAALPRVTRMHITVVDEPVAGDTVFPEIVWRDWRQLQRSATQFHDGVAFHFSVWERR